MTTATKIEKLNASQVRCLSTILEVGGVVEVSCGKLHGNRVNHSTYMRLFDAGLIREVIISKNGRNGKIRRIVDTVVSAQACKLLRDHEALS